MSTLPTVVLVPGLRGPAPLHWQTWLGHRLEDRQVPVVTVPLLGRQHVDLDERVRLLDDTVRRVGGPVMIAAHSAGSVITVHWAHRHPVTATSVVGALLATPPDLVSPLGAEYPSLEQLAELGWTDVPQCPLPFPSVVAASSTDAIGRLDLVTASAASWGSRVEFLGDVGHLNPKSGYGPWVKGEQLVEEMLLGAPATA